MLRILLGLAFAAIPPLLELGEGIPDDWEGAFRPIVWALCLFVAIACVASGVIELRRELRDDRAYAAHRRPHHLSPFAASLLRPFVVVTLVALCLLCQVEAEDGRTEWRPKEEVV